LARWQADWVAARLRDAGADVEQVPIATSGDRDQRGPVERIGSQGVFTKEIQRALLQDRIDLAVHSLKDLPTEPVPGLRLAAVPSRAPVDDVLVCREADSLEALAEGAAVGTGSLRRRTQLLYVRRDLDFCGIRGNVETRLAKVENGEYDAVVLARAGLERLELADRISCVLPFDAVLPAVGQGALGIECRGDDHPTREVLGRLTDRATEASVLAERAMLAALHGGCMAPIAAWGRFEDGGLVLSGRVMSIDGRQRLEATHAGSAEQPEALGRGVAEDLLSQGAGILIAEARHD
jgi:hydroxymethylbilane synthase